jgi:hypothetical protein
MTDPFHRAARGAVVVLAAAALLVGCAGGGTLLRASDVEGVKDADHSITLPPGRVWCFGVASDAGQSVTRQSTLVFDEKNRVLAGAAVITHEDATADEMLAEAELDAEDCARGAEGSEAASIEPLMDLDRGVLGWRFVDDSIEYADGTTGRWGEFALVPLDENHLLAVGFETVDDDPPVDLDELIRIARERAERSLDD